MLRNYSNNYTLPETLQLAHVKILLLNRYFKCYNFKNNYKTKHYKLLENLFITYFILFSKIVSN